MPEPPDPEARKCIQQIVVFSLYYGVVVDPTLLTALNIISRQQSKRTQKITKAVNLLQDDLITHAEDTVKYGEADMVLPVHNNT